MLFPYRGDGSSPEPLGYIEQYLACPRGRQNAQEASTLLLEKVYDASLSKFWEDESHMKKHPAGNDLTEMIKTAPHGEEKILQMPVVGELLPVGIKMEKSAHEKVFYFMAYMNPIFVFLITSIIAL